MRDQHRFLAILIKPEKEWQDIKLDPDPLSQHVKSYLIPLAAVSPVFRFLSNILYGQYRIPFLGWSWSRVEKDLLYSIISYLLSIVMVIVLLNILNSLASRFAAVQNKLSAGKLALYSLTPYLLGGIFYLVPKIGWMIKTLVSLYGVFILYFGFKKNLMEAPREKVKAYFIASAIWMVAIIIGVEVFKLGFALLDIIKVF